MERRRLLRFVDRRTPRLVVIYGPSRISGLNPRYVMAGLVPAIDVLTGLKAWMPAT